MVINVNIGMTQTSSFRSVLSTGRPFFPWLVHSEVNFQGHLFDLDIAIRQSLSLT